LTMDVLAFFEFLGRALFIAGSIALSIIINTTLSDLSYWVLAFS
jgi:hypothetical protein